MAEGFELRTVPGVPDSEYWAATGEQIPEGAAAPPAQEPAPPPKPLNVFPVDHQPVFGFQLKPVDHEPQFIDQALDTGRNMPETAETLQAQQQQLIDGGRSTQMFPAGTPELPVPEGAQRLETERGAFHYDPQQVSPQQIVDASAAGRENDVLNLGPYSKPEIEARVMAGEKPVIITERTPQGLEIRSAAGTSETAKAQQDHFERTKMPGSTISVSPLVQPAPLPHMVIANAAKDFGKEIVQSFLDNFDPNIKDEHGVYEYTKPITPNAAGKIPRREKDWLDTGIAAADIASNFIGLPGGAAAKAAGVSALKAIFLAAPAKIAEKAARMDKILGAPEALAKIAAGLDGDITRAVEVARMKIFDETGAFKGADGKWRIEVSDKDAFITNPGARTAGQAMPHPELYAEHPDLAEAKMLYSQPPGRGSYQANPETISISNIEMIDPQRRSAMLHELTHGVQRRSGFALGADPAEIRRSLPTETDSSIIEQLRGAISRGEYGKPGDPNFDDKVVRQLLELESQYRDSKSKELYTRSAGEVEARNVERRKDMTQEERRAIPPWATEDVPREMQIVDFGTNAKLQAAFPGFKLDNSALARAKRAEKMGFNLPAYHATRADFTQFQRARGDVGIHFGTPGQANDRVAYTGRRMREPSGERVIPVLLKLKRPLRMQDLGQWQADNMRYGLVRTGLFSKEEVLKAMQRGRTTESQLVELRDLIKSKGYDGIVYKNTGEVEGREALQAAIDEANVEMAKEFGNAKRSFTLEEQGNEVYKKWQAAMAAERDFREKNARDSFIVFDANQIRSVNAEFDPKKAHLGNVMASEPLSGAPGSAIDTGPLSRGLRDFVDEPGQAGAKATAGSGGGLGRGAGSEGLAEAQGAAKRAAGAVAPIEDLPVKALDVGGKPYVPGPISVIHDVARGYMKSAGMPYRPLKTYAPVNEARAKRIADAYEKMPHAPNDPKVKAAYDAMIDETVAQYRALEKTGLQIEFIKPGQPDPYRATPRTAAVDVRDNNHLWVFPTEQGFGSSAADVSGNPLLRKTGIKIDGVDTTANDIFRIVHDYYGHLQHGFGFRAAGEENAWRSHSRMYSDLARPAMTTETRGQNSWLNYGPHGEKNRTAKSEATTYADQKTGLLPDWVSKEGAEEPFKAPLTEAGSRVIGAGVEGPTHKVQTVADPYRMAFPGIYENPSKLAKEAAERVVPEHPAMKQLWGVTRRDLEDIGRGRVGNEEPKNVTAKNPRGALSAQNIQTPRNTQRLIDILGEAGKYPGLAHADAWYVNDPVYKRMAELVGPEEAKLAYTRFNTMMGMASPSSPVPDEIVRGTAAHHMAAEGRFEDFNKANIPERFRGGDFPEDLRHVKSHPYGRTAHAEPMAKYLEAGSIQSKQPKVPLYVHASGVPETGFQTKSPVGDAHFSRGVGLADTRKGPTDYASSFSGSESQTLQPWWQNEVAKEVGLESAPAQARLWTVLGPRTGIDSPLGQSKLELLSIEIMKAAKRLKVSPETARDLILTGKAGAGVMAAVAVGLGANAKRDVINDEMTSDLRGEQIDDYQRKHYDELHGPPEPPPSGKGRPKTIGSGYGRALEPYLEQ